MIRETPNGLMYIHEEAAMGYEEYDAIARMFLGWEYERYAKEIEEPEFVDRSWSKPDVPRSLGRHHPALQDQRPRIRNMYMRRRG